MHNNAAPKPEMAVSFALQERTMSGRPPFEPTDKQRAQVEKLAGFGVPQDDIATILGISAPTLRIHFRQSLDMGVAKANAKIGQTLFQQAMKGNVAAAIFWAKARMGWRETHVVINQTPVATASDDALWAIASRGSDNPPEPAENPDRSSGLVH